MNKHNHYAQQVVPLMVEQGLVLEDQKDEYLEYLNNEIHEEEF